MTPRKILGWLGVGFMLAFSVGLYVPFALVGLLCLGGEAIIDRKGNLVLLNFISLFLMAGNL